MQQQSQHTQELEGDRLFHAIIGTLEDLIMSPAWRDGVTAFCRRHCRT